jgi:hypothetical protein
VFFHVAKKMPRIIKVFDDFTSNNCVEYFAKIHGLGVFTAHIKALATKNVDTFTIDINPEYSGTEFGKTAMQQIDLLYSHHGAVFLTTGINNADIKH